MKEQLDLENGAGRNPFRVPEGYFEALPERVMQRVEQDSSHRHIIRLKRKRLVYAMAAMALCVLAGGYAYRLIRQNSGQESEKLASGQGQNIEMQYITELGESLEMEDLADFVTEDANAGMETEMHYLLESGLELDEILNEYE